MWKANTFSFELCKVVSTLKRGKMSINEHTDVNMLWRQASCVQPFAEQAKAE